MVGITAACTVKRRVLVLCTSMVAVEQWKYQFQLWSDIDARHISRFTREHKEQIPPCGVTVTTYSMVSHSGKRSADAQALMDRIYELEWGLLILDEVQVSRKIDFILIFLKISKFSLSIYLYFVDRFFFKVFFVNLLVFCGFCVYLQKNVC